MMAALASLTIIEWITLICAVGVACTLPIILVGRMRFIRQVGALRRIGLNASAPPDQMLRGLTLMVIAQACVDASFVAFLAYMLFVSVTSESAAAYLAAAPSLWPWLIVLLARLALESAIRSVLGRVRVRYGI